MNAWTKIKTNPARMASFFGLAGIGILTAAILVTALGYTGTGGERYSPLNHWVSELGEVGVSELAAVFNLGLVASGVCLAVFMVGVALTMEGQISWYFGAAGLVSGASGLLVGAFPMNNLDAHASVALLFFGGGLIAIVIFTVYALFLPSENYPRWMALPGVPVIIAFVLFVVEIAVMSRTATFSFAAPQADERLDIWWVAIYEWLVVVTMLLWIAVVSLRLRRQQA